MLSVSSLKNTRQSASSALRFAKKCACLGHDSFGHESDDGRQRLVKLDSSRRRSWYQELLKRKLITEKQKYVCEACIRHCNTHLILKQTRTSFGRGDGAGAMEIANESDSEDNSHQEEGVPPVAEKYPGPAMDNSDRDEDRVEQHPNPTTDNALLKARIFNLRESLKKIEYDDLPEDVQQDLVDLSKDMGHLISDNVYRDGLLSSTIYRDPEAFANTKPLAWAAQQNPVLLGFLCACTGVDLSTSNMKKSQAVTHAIEQVQYARNLRTVTPFAFQRNLISYSIARSKTIAKLMGIVEPAGSYTTVHSFLDSPSPIIPPECDQEHSLHVTFDNNQKVGHSSGRIRESSTVPLSICTATTYIRPAFNSTIQQHGGTDDWLNWSGMDSDAVSRLEDNCRQVFRSYRNQFLNNILKEVLAEQDCNGDHVDLEVLYDNYGLDQCVCRECKHVHPKADNICPKCNADATNNNMPSDRYHLTPSQHPDTPPSVQIGEPCMVNPNNVANTKKVLMHIREQCDIPNSRKWVVVWSDGVPYLYMCKLYDTVYMCNYCNEEVNIKEKTLEQHNQEYHPEEGMADAKKLFGFVLPMPGPGHIELNMAKSLLAFLWTPFLSVFVSQLGFRTPRAQDAVRAGVDHHRSRQILEATLQALAAELVLPYVRVCAQNSTEPSATRYFDWYNQSVNDPVYHFLFDCCFTYLLSLKLYNEATRKNHSERMLAARVVFAPLFCGRNHPKYRELHLRDLILRSQCPESVGKHINENEAFSVSGSHKKGQGADFIQEEKNRTVKSFLPPGMPTETIWRNISRKADSLVTMRECYLQSLGCDVELESATKPVALQREVTCFRRLLRSKHYVSSPTPRPLTALNGELLDNDLLNFKCRCLERHEEYKNHVARFGFERSLKIKQVYITPEERRKHESIESKTKAEITEEIKKMLDCMPDKSVVLDGKPVATYLRGKTHDKFVETYYDVCSVLVEQLASLNNETLVEANTLL